MTTFRAIPGYEGQYEVSDTGQVKTLNDLSGNERLLKLHHDEKGYPAIILGNKQFPPRRRWRVHQLVALAFIGPRPKGMQVNHKDGDKTNNHISNLEYITGTENIRHACRLGLVKPRKGELNGAAKLNEMQVRVIRRILEKKTGKRHGPKLADIGKLFGVGHRIISDIWRRKAWAT